MSAQMNERQGALEFFASPFIDKGHKLYVFDREMILLDKVTGVPIEDVDDATAVHYFLQWLTDQRQGASQRQKNAIECVHAVSLKGGV